MDKATKKQLKSEFEEFLEWLEDLEVEDDAWEAKQEAKARVGWLQEKMGL